MIVELVISNLGPFFTEESISFVSSKSNAHLSHVVRGVKRDDFSVLRSGVIYAANTAGKSWLVKAIRLIQLLARGKFPVDYIKPFKLANNTQMTSKIVITIMVEGSYYEYGTEFDIKGFTREWLKTVNRRSSQLVFDRKVISGENEMTFGIKFSDDKTFQFNEFLAEGTPVNKSFLSEDKQRNGKMICQIDVVNHWFEHTLRVIFPDSKYLGVSRFNTNEKTHGISKLFLRYFNTGVVDIAMEEISAESVDLPDFIVKDIMAEAKPSSECRISSSDGKKLYYFVADENNDIKIYKQRTVHKDQNGQDVKFDMEDESDGTLRLLDFLPMLVDFCVSPAVYIIDEIDRSFHPVLTQMLQKFYDKTLGKSKNTQLIYTTHDAELLDLNIFRWDEISFVEKKDGAAHITSTSDLKPSKDIRRNYLEGKYGAIPIAGAVDFSKLEEIIKEGGKE